MCLPRCALTTWSQSAASINDAERDSWRDRESSRAREMEVAVLWWQQLRPLVDLCKGTFIQDRCEPSSPEWVLMPTSWQYSLSRMGRHSLSPAKERRRTHSATKKRANLNLPGPHFSRTTTPRGLTWEWESSRPLHLTGQNVVRQIYEDKHHRGCFFCHHISPLLLTFWEER